MESKNRVPTPSLIPSFPHPSSEKKLPIKSSKLSRQFHSIRNCLCQHSPFFHNNPVTDRLLFPFVKLFPNKGLQTFEIFLTFASHWLQPLYESFPCVSPVLSEFFEAVLVMESPELVHVIKQTSLISSLFDCLLCLFTDVLSREAWLQVFDFLFCFSEYPELLFLLVPALLIILKQDLLDFAKLQNLPEMPNSHPQTDSDQFEPQLEDLQLESLTRQISFANKLDSHKSRPDFELSLAHFTESFLAKIRLLSGTRIIRRLHFLLRKCYSNSLINLRFSHSEQQSTEFHYPIFKFTTKLII